MKHNKVHSSKVLKLNINCVQNEGFQQNTTNIQSLHVPHHEKDLPVGVFIKFIITISMNEQPFCADNKWKRENLESYNKLFMASPKPIKRSCLS